MLKPAPGAPASAVAPEREARAISFVGDDGALVAALRERHPAAIVAFHDRYAAHMLKLLARILGQDAELEDVHHEVFVRALGSIGSLKDPACLDPWMVSVAVFSARTCLQRRYRGKWLNFFAPEELAEQGHARPEPDWNALAEVRLTYAVLDRLSANDRLAFTLRYIEGMGLTDLAEACHVSLATAKRRLKRAETRFVALARREPALADWLAKGGRWTRD